MVVSVRRYHSIIFIKEIELDSPHYRNSTYIIIKYYTLSIAASLLMPTTRSHLELPTPQMHGQRYHLRERRGHPRGQRDPQRRSAGDELSCFGAQECSGEAVGEMVEWVDGVGMVD